MSKVTELSSWHIIENDGSGDYYLVPEGLFLSTLEEAAYDDPDFDEKFQQCIYVGGLSSDIKIRGEITKN